MRIRSRASHVKPLSQSLGGNLQETLEIITWHAEIDIIIPRDKAAMTPGPEHRAGVDEVHNPILATHAIDCLKNP